MRKVLVAAALLLGTASANAAVITSLYSTGTDAAHAATTGNGADLHWTLIGGTAYTGGTNGSFPIGPWVTDTATARWITPTTNAGDNNGIATYTYETTFTLTSAGAANAQINGKFAADDEVTAVRLNGNVVGIVGGGFRFYSGFNVTGAGFVAGVNTLSFDVLNSGGGPTGLQVDLGGTAAVPEPATWGLMLAGFGMVGFAARRRVRSLAA